MYRLIRNTHLLLGLFTALFVLMYAVSAVQMAHRIKLAPAVTEVDIRAAAGLEARPLALVLMNEHGCTGELGTVRTVPAGFAFAITSVGGSCNAAYDRASGVIHLRHSVSGVMGVLNRLHHLHGFTHERGVVNLWAWALAFISVTLLILGGTGVYMWFRLYKERMIGGILLAANLVVSLALLIALRG